MALTACYLQSFVMLLETVINLLRRALLKHVRLFFTTDLTDLFAECSAVRMPCMLKDLPKLLADCAMMIKDTNFHVLKLCFNQSLNVVSEIKIHTQINMKLDDTTYMWKWKLCGNCCYRNKNKA